MKILEIKSISPSKIYYKIGGEIVIDSGIKKSKLPGFFVPESITIPTKVETIESVSTSVVSRDTRDSTFMDGDLRITRSNSNPKSLYFKDTVVSKTVIHSEFATSDYEIHQADSHRAVEIDGFWCFVV